MSYNKLKILFQEQSLLNDINGILSWDMATYMPKNSRSQRVKQIKKIYDYKKSIFNKIKKEELFKKVNELNLNLKEKSNLDLMKNKFEYFETIPYEKIKKKASLSIECEGFWRSAKHKSNYNIVKKKFKELVNVIREEAEILSQKKNKTKYDCLILNYDRSLDTKILFKIFNNIEKFLKSKIQIISKKQNKSYDSINKEFLSEEEQFILSKIFMKKLGFDFSRGRIDKSLHPFCGGSSQDIRITTRFNKNDSFSCFDALMHETGHGLYEQGLPKKWAHQPLGSAGGMSLHESQSLFIEMQIIKSLPVSRFIEKTVKMRLKKNSDYWTSSNIYKLRKKVRANFIRVDADEVHYPLHILHRFNLEKEIIENKFNVDYLPDLWNQEFFKIFKIKVNNDSEGCLQDIHWYGGDFGYFPTYSIGAFIAAQIFYKIKSSFKELNELLSDGNFKPIIKWLNRNIHKNGSFYKINELLTKVTGEELNLKYYKNHIIERYIEEIK